MKTLKRSFRLLKYNISSVILFEIMYKLLATAVLTPLLYTLIMYSLKMANIDYLNDKNISNYLKTPFTYLVLFLVLLIISAYVLLQMSGLIYAYEASYNKKKTNPVLMFLKAILNSLRVIRPRNMMFALYVLLVLPFTYTIIISASVAGVRIPDYIETYFFRNKFLLAILIVVYGSISLFSMMRIFSLNFFSLYKMDYKSAVEESRLLIRKKVFSVLAGIILLNVFITILLFVLEWIVVSGTTIILRHVVPYKSLGFVIHTIVQVSFLIIYIIFSVISTPIICAYICGCFYEMGGENEEETHKNKLRDDGTEENILHKKKSKVITIIVILLGLILNSIYLYLDFNNRYKLNFWRNSIPEITAHRGDSKHAPENTMASIKLAAENQADIVEIDVRQTKDGEFVILHDENLRRTTGVSKRIGDLEYDYVKTLDPGAKFSDEYNGERIPTLAEVLEYAAEEDIFLNIELKPAKTDQNYVEGVMELIHGYERLDRCVIASQSYKLLEQVKEIDPEAKTVLILSMAIGDLGNMEAVDVYSIRYNFVTAGLVRDAHRRGKEVYAWTVNNKDIIENLMLMDVDSIITDNPYWAKKIVYAYDENLITSILKRLLMEY